MSRINQTNFTSTVMKKMQCSFSPSQLIKNVVVCNTFPLMHRTHETPILFMKLKFNPLHCSKFIEIVQIMYLQLMR